MSIESLPFIYKSIHLTGKKLNRSLITCIHGRDPGKLSNHQNGQTPLLKYHLQLNIKGDIGDREPIMRSYQEKHSKWGKVVTQI